MEITSWLRGGGGSQNFWRQHYEIKRLGGMLDATITPRESVLLSCWAHVIEVSDAGIQGSTYEERIGDVAFFAVDNPSVNAWAIATRERSAVVVSRGMMTSIADALSRAFVETTIFNDAYPPHQIGHESDMPDDVAPALTGGITAPGLIGERIELLYQLYCRIASLVLSHEMAHIARKHLDILRGWRRLSMIDEALQLSSRQFGNDQARFLEFDADFHALDMLLMGEQPENDDPEQSSAKQAEETAFVLSFAAIVLAQLLDRGEPDLTLQAQRSHPPPVWRAVFLTSLLMETLIRETGATAQAIEQSVEAAWGEAENVASVLHLTPERWQIEGELQRVWRLEDFEEMRARYVPFAKNVIDPRASGVVTRMPVLARLKAMFFENR